MVIEKARELGLALSESPEFERMLKARAAIEENQALTEALELCSDKQRLLADLLAGSDEGDASGDLAMLSNEIEDLQNDLTHNPIFEEMLEAQKAFARLMQRVNKVIGACIGADDTEEDDACGGDCAACGGGCRH